MAVGDMESGPQWVAEPPAAGSRAAEGAARGGVRGARRLLATLMVLAVALGLAWRVVRYGANFPLWGDEASLVMSLLTRDYAGMLRAPLEVGQIAPLGYMWLELLLSRTLGLGEWGLRLPAFLAGAASVVLFWRLAVATCSRRAALLAVAILAASYYPVRHATEVKPYAVDLLVALVVTLLAWRAARNVDSPGRWAVLAAASAIGVWMSFPAVFVVAGAGLFLGAVVIRRASPRAVAGLGALAVLAGGSFAAVHFLYNVPMAKAAFWYFGDASQWATAWPPLRQPWKLPWWLLETHAGNMLAYPIGGKNFGSTATLLLVVAGGLALWRQGRKGLLLLLLAPLGLNLLAACLRKYPYGGSARTGLYLAPAFCLLAGLGLARVLRAIGRRFRGRDLLTPGAVLVLGAIAIVGAAYSVLVPYKDRLFRDIRSSVRAVAAQTSAQDRWVIANSLEPTEHAPLLMGSGMNTFRYYVALLAPIRTTWGEPPGRIAAAGGRTWLIYFEDPLRTDPQQRERLGIYVQALLERLGEPVVRTYLLRSNARAETPRSITTYAYPGAHPAPATSGGS